MPSMANITVKASDGTTDVVYVSLTPSAGDTVPARWGVEAMSAIPGHRATLSSVAQYNGPRTARRHRVAMTYPVVEEIDGRDTITGIVPIEAVITVPTNLSGVATKEAYYQFGNLLISALLRSQFDSGYAPT